MNRSLWDLFLRFFRFRPRTGPLDPWERAMVKWFYE